MTVVPPSYRRSPRMLLSRHFCSALGLATAAALLLCGLQIAQAASPTAAPFRADRLLVKPKAARHEALGRFHQEKGVRLIREFSGIEGIQVVGLPPGGDPSAMAKLYQQSGLVEFAEPDFRLHLAATPNDPRYADGSLWHLHNFGQNFGTAGADIHAAEGWDTLNSASNVIVAMIDTGIRYTHEDLAANVWVNPGEIPGNGIDDDGDGIIDDVHGINAAADSGDPVDVLGHGTQVAGFIGAVGNNARGGVGVAWRVKLMACRFYDDAGNGFVSDAVQAIDFARVKGAQIINTSFVNTNYSSTLLAAINSCRTAGIIFVAAAGNSAQNTDLVPYYPADYDLDNVVSVAATTRNDTLAYFSNYGATSVDLAAPGLDVVSTVNFSDNAYYTNSGTSFSSPIVAGAFALMRARYPAENYRRLIDRMLATVDPLPGLAGKCVSGGRLNIARALNPGLEADFLAAPALGLAPLTVHFTDVSFGTITNRLWQFGDGSTSREDNPVHTYTIPGTYPVKLTITINGGAALTTNHSVMAVPNYQMTNAAFAWIDPASMPVLGLTGNDVSPAQPLPFNFRFYGQEFTALFVGANGLLGFDSAGLSSAVNVDLPNASLPYNLICPFWDDLSPAANSVHLGTVGTAPNRKAVISWVNATGGSGPQAAFTFQVVLQESLNTILFQYLAVQGNNHNPSTAGRSATVGLEHISGLIARRFSYNGSTPLANNQAILFIPSAVATSPPPAAVTLVNPRRVGATLVFSFLSQTGVAYSVQSVSGFPQAIWPEVERVMGTGGPLQITNAPVLPQSFYRVEAR